MVGSKTGMFSSTIGDPVGTFVGLDEGERDGSFDGVTVGTLLGLFEGDSSGSGVGWMINVKREGIELYCMSLGSFLNLCPNVSCFT